ncbi:conserved hypothetical protein [Nitrosococcus halophilus Nc 4]|uniref:Uncharacterized protein n=1 Tax=Nitrosococcus halophilus (strain Nc4) TaxID=472759 RepID=D5BUW3_NITHN|nr:hypothetical protein [Nitrosococcus halophilus]ADE13513.1 conserved hypothetical protein [Nitrosococcus halophilus Nc 4]
MELDEAREILNALANGVDPVTGEVLPETSPYNEPKVIRALFTVLNSLKGKRQPKKTLEEKQQENIAAGRPRNAGLPWTDDLKGELAEKFQSGVALDELARYFERTRGAILSELAKQGFIEQAEVDELGGVQITV